MQLLRNREISERNHFDRMAAVYDSNYGYKRAFFEYKKYKKLKHLVDLYQKTSGRRLSVLEIGCGTGEYSQNLAGLFPESDITSIDISPGILKQAKAKCKGYKNIKFRVASAYKLPFRKGQFDLVCGFYIAHHLELKEMFSEVSRVLKHGGFAYFVEPNLFNPVVFLIKTVPWLKQKAGDSPDETAINPVTITNKLPSRLFLYKVFYSEYLPPLGFVSDSILISLDKITNILGNIPIINLIGGSLIISLKKI